MTQLDQNNALKKEIYETHLLRDSNAIVVTHLREYRHRVFVCECCSEDWNSAQEYFDHLPCPEDTGTEENRNVILLAMYDAKWKEIYNTIRDIYQSIVSGKRPFRAVPYCTCETFKDHQDCACMMEKRRDAYKKLVQLPCKQLFFCYQHYMRFKRDVLLLEINTERDAHLAHANQNYEGHELENMRELVEKMAQEEIRQMERKLENKFQELVTAIEKTVEKDIEEIGTRGRRRVEPITLSTEQVDSVTEHILQQLKCATFLVSCWGDITSSQLAKSCEEHIRNGLANNDTNRILEANDSMEACRRSLDRCSVYYAIMAKSTFLHEWWDNEALTKRSNERVRNALCVDTIDLVEEFKKKWMDYVFKGETALEDFTLFLENLDRETEDPSAVLGVTEDTCQEQARKAIDLMNRIREDAKSEDWDLLGNDTFDKACEILHNPEIPMYPVEQMLRDFVI